MKKILIFCLCLIAFPISSKAINKCSIEEEMLEQDYLNNVDVSYSVSINKDVATYSVTLKNLTSNMLYKSPDGKMITSSKFQNGTSTFNLKSGSTVRIYLFSKKCINSSGLTSSYKDISVPSYNKYYSRKECEGLENNFICQKWSSYSVDEKTFKADVKKLQDLQKKKEDNSQEKLVKVKKKWYEITREVVAKFWWVFIIIIVGIIGIYYAIWSKNKKNQFDFKV